MPVDPSIALGVRPLQFENPTNALAQIMHMQALQQQSQLGALQLRQQQQAMADDEAVRKLYAEPGFSPATPQGLQRLMSVSPKVGQAAQAAALDAESKRSTIDLNKAKAGKEQIDTLKAKTEMAARELVGVTDAAGAAAWVDKHATSPEEAAATKASIPTDPAKFVDWRNNEILKGITLHDQMTLQQQRLVAAETARHNQATEKNATMTAAEAARHNQAAEATARGQLGVAQGSLAVSRDRLAMEKAAPKGIVHDTDAGTALIDPRTGQARLVTDPSGNVLQKPLKDIPAAVNTAIISNAQSLGQVDRALTLLSGKDVGEQKGDAAATGIKGYLPQAILNRVDPKGVDVRAEVADIGSLKIHDRSGAAVTLSEAPRLMPFIPLATDDLDTATKKLKRLKLEIQNETKALGDTYSREQGYKPNPVKPIVSGGGGFKYLGKE